MNTIRKGLFPLLISMILVSCTEETILTIDPNQSALSSNTEKVHVVPLKIYMEKKVNSRTPDELPTFGNSWGELPLPDGMGTSVARNLIFYVYSRAEGTSGDFLYNEQKSSDLNSIPAWNTLTQRIFYGGNGNDRTFATVEVSFAKEKGQEYKILVTASGKEQETTAIRGVINNTKGQKAEALHFQTNNNAIKDGDSLDELTAAIIPTIAPNVPKLRNSDDNNDVDYDSNIPVYGLQEGFYGFCESQTTTKGDENIITYNNPATLRAYLIRNVARVEFKITNIWYTGTLQRNYSFPWMGIYAAAVNTQSNANEYDRFRNSLSSAGEDWKLLTYYDELNKGNNTINGFGNVLFTKDNAGSVSFVTYMLPTVTRFKLRIKWNRNGTSDITSYKYCHDIEIPFNKHHSYGDTGGSVGVIPPPPYSGNTLTVQCNRNYIITMDGNKLLETTK